MMITTSLSTLLEMLINDNTNQEPDIIIIFLLNIWLKTIIFYGTHGLDCLIKVGADDGGRKNIRFDLKNSHTHYLPIYQKEFIIIEVTWEDYITPWKSKSIRN